MLDYKNGNLMEFVEDAFGHGCNCFKRMGSGVALAVKNTYPEMTDADTNSECTPKQRLGTIMAVSLKNGKIGYNIYSQFNYGSDKIQVDYLALEKALILCKENMKIRSLKSLALPKIGCGLAGGDWNIVEKIIEKVFEKTDIKITIYSI